MTWNVLHFKRWIIAMRWYYFSCFKTFSDEVFCSNLAFQVVFEWQLFIKISATQSAIDSQGWKYTLLNPTTIILKMQLVRTRKENTYLGMVLSIYSPDC